MIILLPSAFVFLPACKMTLKEVRMNSHMVNDQKSRFQLTWVRPSLVNTDACHEFYENGWKQNCLCLQQCIQFIWFKTFSIVEIILCRVYMKAQRTCKYYEFLVSASNSPYNNRRTTSSVTLSSFSFRNN